MLVVPLPIWRMKSVVPDLEGGSFVGANLVFALFDFGGWIPGEHEVRPYG